ncbi:MAG: FAD-dependent thymidylate synthase [Proteobacteria bacterium]|nr:FAD-dependent thymidylate synthase [Pseudomonadota bacterium]MCP4920572.1 FAD-dependent thymidylate synthase [Pseudomonadota bacterium]
MKLSPDMRAAIDDARAQSHTTRRATVPALEEMLYEPTFVLDHGFVRCIDYMGDDAAVVQAARVSYGRGTKKSLQDRGLIRYLMRHRHTTPFEMCELKLHVKLPIFVARQWIRHRTANVNEYSARYSILDNEFYLPTHDQLAVQSQNNKQGRGEVLSGDDAERVLELLKRDAMQSYDTYTSLMEDHGLARELARMDLPVNFYTQWYWKVDLHNLMHFLSLRMHPHAQYEIRVYGDAIADYVKAWCPHTWEAFDDYRLNGAFLSKASIGVVKKLIAGEQVEQKGSGLSPREWRELMGVIEG